MMGDYLDAPKNSNLGILYMGMKTFISTVLRIKATLLLFLLFALVSCGPLNSNQGGDGIPIEGIQYGSKTFEYKISTVNYVLGVGFATDELNRDIEVFEKSSGEVQSSFVAKDTVVGENRVIATEDFQADTAGFRAEFDNISTGQGASSGLVKFKAQMKRDNITINENYLDSETLPAGVGLQPFSCIGKENESFFAGGDGTARSPYLICSLEQLDNMHIYFANRNFKLMANIDMNDPTILPDGWDPLGSSTLLFDGVFDGGGRTLDNLFIDLSFVNGVGFFGYVKGAKISNLNITNAQVRGTNRVGILIGDSQGVNIENVHVSGGVWASQTTAGGLVGQIKDPNSSHWLCSYQISNSSAAAVVEAEISKAGGLVGVASCSQSSTRIYRSFATGSVTGTASNSQFIGGLFGIILGGEISQSYSSSTVSGYATIGGLIAQSFEVKIYDSYASGNVTAQGGEAAGLIANYMNTNIIQNSYASGDVVAQAGRASGMVAGQGTSAALIITNSFSASTITSNDSPPRESGILTDLPTAQATQSISNTKWLSTGGGAANCLGGVSSVSGCTAETLKSNFYSSSNAPLSSWDFLGESVNGTEEIWKTTATLPELNY